MWADFPTGMSKEHSLCADPSGWNYDFDMLKLPQFLIRRSVFVLVFAPCLYFAASAQQYDLVINNGRVMDPETGLDAIRNVAVQDKKIVAISADAMQGKTVIDATGLVVAPGFIDLHSHGQDAENYRYKAMDGVTTALELERGVFPAAP